MRPGRADAADELAMELHAEQEASRVGNKAAPEAPDLNDVIENRAAKGKQDKGRKGQVEKFEQPETRGKVRRGLEPGIQAQLGGMLRVSYQALVNEPVPERFLRLLERLERTENLD